jgi:prepilin-type processing-associated H-X9-DG protein
MVRPASAAGASHQIYANSGRHAGGDTFVFADGHAKWMKIDQTLDCDSFKWGIKAYNQGGATVKCAATGLPVQ